MIQVCVFDMGKVVLDFDFERFYAKVLPYCRPGVGRKELDPIVAVRDDALGCGLISFESYYQQFCEAGLEMPLADFTAAWQDIFSEITETTSLIRRLQGVRKVLLSNTDAVHIDWVKQRFPQVMSLLEQHYFSFELHQRKPAPEVFRAVETGTGYPAAQHVLIDDMEENILAAKNAGWEGIRFTGAVELERELKEFGLKLGRQ